METNQTLSPVLLYILGRTNLLGSLFSLDGMLGMVSGLDFSGSSSSYGAPDPGYGAPAPAPAPSYSAPAPSYNGASAKSDKVRTVDGECANKSINMS